MSEMNELVNVNINKVQESVVIVNNDKPLFKKQDYQTIEGKPKYFELDEYGRSSGAIAMLSIDTIPLVTKKKIHILYQVVGKYTLRIKDYLKNVI